MLLKFCRNKVQLLGKADNKRILFYLHKFTSGGTCSFDRAAKWCKLALRSQKNQHKFTVWLQILSSGVQVICRHWDSFWITKVSQLPNLWNFRHMISYWQCTRILEIHLLRTKTTHWQTSPLCLCVLHILWGWEHCLHQKKAIQVLVDAGFFKYNVIFGHKLT